jgi:exopolysaccharide biosynthesis polyprenyl glycosylphosphotransferase
VNRALDVVGASAALALASPALALAALAVKLEDGGPVLYRQRRVGLHGREFELVKLRTMVVGAEREGAGWAVNEGDPRITRVGRLLRRLSVDELPQLWNIVRGDMSLIGPRPERVQYVERFEDAIYRYPDRHRVKSGLTGWAHVNGLRGETSLADRIEWDNFYIENWSFWLDLKILVKTIPAMLVGRGAG